MILTLRGRHDQAGFDVFCTGSCAFFRRVPKVGRGFRFPPFRLLAFVALVFVVPAWVWPQASTAVFQAAPDPGSRSTVRSVISIEGLTLRGAIELALRNSRSLEKAALSREVQRFDLRVANDEFAPDLDLSSGVRYNPARTNGLKSETRFGTFAASASQRVPTGGRFAIVWDTDGTEIRPGSSLTNYGSSLYVSFEQPLLRGGGVKTNLVNLRIARLNERTNILQFRRTVIDTVTSVVFSYRALLRAKLELEVNEAALQRARDQLVVNRTLVEAGMLPPVEIIQTEADIAAQEVSALTARSSLESARFSLIKLLDIDRGTALDPTDTVAIPEFTLTIEEARPLAYQNRVDYLQAEQAVKIAELRLTTARNRLLWDLSVDTRYYAAGSDVIYRNALDRTFSRANEDWSVGVTLNIPFGDLGRRRDLLQARSQVQRANLDLVEAVENIEIELVELFRGIEISRQRVRVAGIAHELAARKLELEKGKLQTGLTSNFAVVTFQNDLVRARLSEINAQISYVNALTALEQTLGTTLEGWGIQVEELDDGGPPRTLWAAPGGGGTGTVP